MLMGDFNFGPTDDGWAAVKSLGFEALINPPLLTTVGDVSLFDNIWINPQKSKNFTGDHGVVKWDLEMYALQTTPRSAAA
jgi:hypothetical protein